MKNKASSILIVMFLLVTGISAFYLANKLYEGDRTLARKIEKKVDSIENIAVTRKGRIEEITVNSKAGSYGFVVAEIIYFLKFSSSDSLYSLPSRYYISQIASADSIKIKFLMNPKTGQFDILEYWLKNKKYFGASEYIEVPRIRRLKLILAFIMLFGLAFIIICLPLLNQMFWFIIGWLKLTRQVKRGEFEKKKILGLQLTLLQKYINKWDKSFAIQLFAGLSIAIVIYFVPVKYLGLRQFIHYVTDGDGNETMASSFGYLRVTFCLIFISLLFSIEFFLVRNGLKKDIISGEMITVKGKVLQVFRDKNDNNQLKTNLTIGKMELEGVEIAENTSFKKGEAVNVDIAYRSLQPIGISKINIF